MTAPVPSFEPAADASPDTACGRVQRPRALGPRPRRHPVAVGHRPHPARHPPRGAPPARARAGSRRSGAAPHAGRDRRRARRVARVRVAATVVTRRHLPPAAPRLRAPRLDLRQARPDHLGRRGPLPRRAGRRVQAAARPGAARAVRRRARGGRDRPRRLRSTRCSSGSTRPRSRRRRSRRCTRRGCAPARRSWSRCSGRRSPSCFRDDIAALSWLAPRLVGRIPVAALANPPALVELFAETIVEELDFRLEAENMLDIARVLAETDQRGDHRAAPAPDAGHAARARDGAPRRLRVRRRRRRCTTAGIDTARGAARGAHRVARGRDALRRLPRRPARRQPHRAARRAHRAVRLRHHRPARRAAARSRSSGC